MVIFTLGAFHTLLTLVISFMSSLSNVDTDKLVLAATVVLVVVAILVSLFQVMTHETKLGGYADAKYISNTQVSDLEVKDLGSVLSAASSLSALSSLSSLSSLF